MKKLLVLISMFFAFTGVQASDYWQTNQNNAVVVDVVDDTGRVLNQYTTNQNSHKTQRSYLEAIKNKRYKIRLRNKSNRRVGVVVTVDGRNILSGKKSYLRNNERMYVLDPNESADYTGWRTTKNKVNRFYFTSAGDSYSNAWGDRSAMGVIAVAVFNEKYQRRNYENRRFKQSGPSNSLSADESTGTGFGREEYSPTTNVKFVADNRSILKRFIKYEWRESLCKRGVISCTYYEEDNNDNRFWPREANQGYVPYPPGHRKHRRKNRHKNHHHRDKRNTRNNDRILWSDQFTSRWDKSYQRN